MLLPQFLSFEKLWIPSFPLFGIPDESPCCVNQCEALSAILLFISLYVHLGVLHVISLYALSLNNPAHSSGSLFFVC